MSLLSRLSSDQKAKVDNLINGLLDLKNFVLNPIAGMRRLPQWDWTTLASLIALTGLFFGALSGLVSMRVTAIIRGAIVYPISCFIVITVVCLFFHYTLLFFFRQENEFKKIYTISFLSCLPWIVVGPFVAYLAPLNPIGVILSGVLAIVGFSENTGISRKDISRIVLGVIAVFLVFWIINMIRFSQDTRGSREMITPESLDILEKELQD